MRFLEPGWAILFLPAAAALIWSWRHVYGMSRPRKAAAFVIRGLLASFLILALMGPQAQRPNQGVAVMFLLDASDSVSDQDRAAAQKYVQDALGKLRPEDVGGVILFGRQPVMESAPGGRRGFAKPAAKIDGSASDLAAAIRLASASFPEGKGRRIVILSDGNETLGDSSQAVEMAALDGVEVDVRTLGVQALRPEVTALDLEAPSERRGDEPFDLRLLVDSSVEQNATIVLDRDGLVVSRSQVRLPQGRTSVALSQRLPVAGFYRYRATVEPELDGDRRNNIGAAFVAVRGKPRILVLQGPRVKNELGKTLQEQGLQVDVYGPEGIPSRPEELQAYDAVILNDFNAALMAPAQMQLIQTAVRDSGLGLAMIGGEDSFLPGGWYGTPVADALPVDLNIRQRRSFPSTSVLVMVDASGSMAAIEDGEPKIRLAAKAAEQTAQLLAPQDRLGVAGSTDGIEFVAPMQELRDRPGVIAQIRRLSVGGGGIYAEPTIERARQVLEGEESKVRHFILLADGADVDTYGRSLSIIQDMRQKKITTSVIAIGDGKDVPFLRQVAAAGGGNFYLAKSASRLPAIFTQDVAVMSRSAIEDGVFVPKALAGEELVRGLGQLPALYAYNVTDSRPLARTGLKSHKDDPVLAVWQYGLGTSLAFTSDAQARWASQWVPWGGFGPFWAQAVRAVTRRGTQNQYSVTVAQREGRGVVSIDARDKAGQPLGAAPDKVVVALPDGTSQEIPVVQQGPGQFSGSFPARQLGSYIVSVAEEGAGGPTRVSSTGFSVPYPPEYRSYRANTSLMERLSSAADGQLNPSVEQVLRPLADPGATIQDLWMWLVFAAMLLLPLDIANRRIALPWKEAVERFRAWRRRTAVAPANATLERLSRAKARAEVGPGDAPTGPVKTETPVAPTRRQSPRVETGSSAGKTLLERRRKKQDGD